MIHVADILLALFPAAWKGKQHACEAKSLPEALSLQMNLTLHLWKFVPIRKLPTLRGSAVARPCRPSMCPPCLTLT